METNIKWHKASGHLPALPGNFLYATVNGKIGVRVGLMDDWFVMKYGVVLYAFQPDMTNLINQ